MAEAQYLYLTTIGRVSGEPREIETWFTQRGDCYYIIAEYETSNWVRNVRTNPQVQFRVGIKVSDGRGRVLDPSTEAGLIAEVQQLSRDKYGWGEGLVVEVRPSTPTR